VGTVRPALEEVAGVTRVLEARPGPGASIEATP